MMNLELLCWATAYSKDSSFGTIAVNHATTTKVNHFRPNYSSYHLVAYDSTNGSVIKKMTVQGYSDSSSWSRGQGWGLYGYTMMYRYTKDTVYLNQATHVADYILSRLTIADLVPYWDFDVPTSPTPSRDASAAAIYASALIELSTYVTGTSSQTYFQKATSILQSLASASYTAAPNTNGNFILMHSTGNHPAGTEIDVPLNYADYYYLEALLRLKAIDESTAAISNANATRVTGKNHGLRLVNASGAGVVRVNLSIARAVTLRAFDIRGRMATTSASCILDLSGLPDGCYTIHADLDGTALGSARYLKQ